MRNGVVGLAGSLLLAISACGGDGTDATDATAVDSTLPATTLAPPTASGVQATIPDGTSRESWSVRMPSRPGSIRRSWTSISKPTASCRWRSRWLATGGPIS